LQEDLGSIGGTGPYKGRCDQDISSRGATNGSGPSLVMKQADLACGGGTGNEQKNQVRDGREKGTEKRRGE